MSKPRPFCPATFDGHLCDKIAGHKGEHFDHIFGLRWINKNLKAVASVEAKTGGKERT